MKPSGLLITFFLAAFIAGAQPGKITIETQSEILWAGVDRPGDLFLVLSTGEVQKFNNRGQLIGTHGFKTPPTLIDPMDGVQSFYYLQRENLYGNLSYDLADATQHPVDPAFAIAPWLICPSLHELWLLDSSDFSLRKTNMSSMAIAFEAGLKHPANKKADDYRYMREYQNYLFLLDKHAGVLLFNTLG
jgi:hypothetical protein